MPLQLGSRPDGAAEDVSDAPTVETPTDETEVVGLTEAGYKLPVRGRTRPGVVVAAWIETRPLSRGDDSAVTRSQIVRRFADETGKFELELPIRPEILGASEARHELHVQAEGPGYQSEEAVIVVKLLAPRSDLD